MGAKMDMNKTSRNIFFPILLLGVLVILFFSKIVMSPTSIFSPFEDTISQNFLYEGIFRSAITNFRQFPLWNTMIFSGAPFVGNPVIPFYYPLNILIILFPKNLFFSYSVIFHTFLAAVFTYLFARELSLSKMGSFISAVSFVFSSAIIGKVFPGHVQNLVVISLTPLVFYMLEKVLKDRNLKHSILFGGVWALQLLGGQMQFFLFSSLALLFYTFLRLFSIYGETKSLKQVFKISSCFAVSLLVCVMLSAFFLVPTYLASKTSIRGGGLDYETATMFSLPLRQAITFFIPDFFGSVVDQTYWGEWTNTWSLQAYIGILPLMLAAVAGIFLIKKSRNILFFLLLSVFSVFFAFGKYTPFYKLFYLYLPGISSFRIPAEQLFLFCFSVAMLAGYGASFLLSTPKRELKKKVRKFIWPLAVLSVACLILTIIVFSIKPAIISYGKNTAEARYLELHPGEQDFEQNYLPKLEKIYGHIAYGTLRFSILLSLSTFAIWLGIGTRLRKTWLFGIFLIIILADLWIYGLPQIGVQDPSKLYQRTGLTDFLGNDTSQFRVYDLSGFVQQHHLSEYGIQTITGYDVLILRDYVHFTNLIGNKTGQAITNLPIGDMDPKEIQNTKILDILNVKYLITRQSADIPGFSLVYKQDDFMAEKDFDKFRQYSNKTFNLYVYQNLNALPRAYLIGIAKIVKNHSEVLAELDRGDFNPREYIVLEKEPPTEHKNVAISQEVDIDYYSPNIIKLNVTIDKPMFLVLSEVWYPGWKAYDNGNEIEIYRTDYILRSVWLDKGMHHVEFRYEPISYKIGKIVSCVTLAILVLALVMFGIFKDRK